MSQFCLEKANTFIYIYIYLYFLFIFIYRLYLYLYTDNYTVKAALFEELHF